MKVTCLAAACFIFWLFNSNVFFSFLRLWHTCAHFHPKRGSKKDAATKNAHILLENIILKLHFQHEGHVDTILLSYIQSIYREFLLFQFFSHGIRTHIPIITGVQNKCITRRKTVIFFFKMLFLKLCLFEMKVNRMPVTWYISWLFTANVVFFSFVVVVSVCTFPS